MEIWVVNWDNRTRSAFTTENSAYSEACDEILGYLMLPEETTSEFVRLYEAKEYKKAFEAACRSGENKLRVHVHSLNLDESNFVQED